MRYRVIGRTLVNNIQSSSGQSREQTASQAVHEFNGLLAVCYYPGKYRVKIGQCCKPPMNEIALPGWIHVLAGEIWDGRK
jgi:hypothetical protein